MFQPSNVTELPSMTIIIYLSGKYAASHHMVDLVGTAANVQTPAYNRQYIYKPCSIEQQLTTTSFLQIISTKHEYTS